MRAFTINKLELGKRKSLLQSNNINRSNNKFSNVANILSLQNSLGNHTTGRLLESEPSLTSANGQIQRKTKPDNNEKKTGCECDCESYGPDIAWQYAKKHMTYPAWFGGSGTPKDLKLFWWHCYHYNISPGCSWVCLVVFEDKKTGKKYTVYVQMHKSKKIVVSEHTNEYPKCEYDFECVFENNANRLKVKETGCEKDIYIPPNL